MFLEELDIFHLGTEMYLKNLNRWQHVSILPVTRATKPKELFPLRLLQYVEKSLLILTTLRLSKTHLSKFMGAR